MVKNPPTSEGHAGSIPGSRRSPGGGHGNPLQYSCLENPMDGGAWLATLHGVAKTQDDWACMHAHPWDKLHWIQIAIKKSLLNFELKSFCIIHQSRVSSKQRFNPHLPFKMNICKNRTDVIVFAGSTSESLGDTPNFFLFSPFRTAEARSLPYQELRFLSVNSQFFVGKVWCNRKPSQIISPSSFADWKPALIVWI